MVTDHHDLAGIGADLIPDLTDRDRARLVSMLLDVAANAHGADRSPVFIHDLGAAPLVDIGDCIVEGTTEGDEWTVYVPARRYPTLRAAVLHAANPDHPTHRRCPADDPRNLNVRPAAPRTSASQPGDQARRVLPPPGSPMPVVPARTRPAPRTGSEGGDDIVTVTTAAAIVAAATIAAAAVGAWFDRRRSAASVDWSPLRDTLTNLARMRGDRD